MLWTQHADTGWLALVDDTRLLVIRRDATSESVANAWDDLTTSSGLQGILDRLARDGLSSTPPFVAVEWDGTSGEAPRPMHCLVRGPIRLQVETPATTVTIDGNRVLTWAEQSFSDAIGFDLRVDQDTVPSSSASQSVWLPLARGAAFVTAVSSGQSSRAAVSSNAVSSNAVSLSAVSSSPVSSSPVSLNAAVPVPVREVVERPADLTLSDSTPADSTLADATLADSTLADSTPADSTLADSTLADATLADSTLSDSTLSEATRADQQHTDSDEGYDHLFGATMVRPIESAAIRETDPDLDGGNPDNRIKLPSFVTGPKPDTDTDTSGEPVTDPNPQQPGGDHDGLTVMSGSLSQLRAGAAPSTTETSAVPRPRFLITLPDGRIESLDTPILIGRAPSVAKVSAGSIPRLVTIAGSDQDISRNHIQIAVQGDSVVVTDLHSRNGTIVVAPGREPQKLRQGEPTTVLTGTVIDLGGDVTLTVCED